MNKTIKQLHEQYQRNEKIVMLTVYDACFARIAEEAGVDILLVGDSLGMTIQGASTTLGVSMEDMLYHVNIVARQSKQALVLADMPFGSYQVSPQKAFVEAARLMQAGAGMVKIEGGKYMGSTVEFLVERGIPVCAHVGLTPQSVHTLGGFRIQGRDPGAAQKLLEDALALQETGATMLVLECVPEELARQITLHLAIPSIGIGAGRYTAGQVLVLQDVLGISSGKPLKFARNFMQGSHSVQEAIQAYVRAVQQGNFPTEEHIFI
jgi:3-methyl-2-oxobutanoate hydroxymethyltransferase